MHTLNIFLFCILGVSLVQGILELNNDFGDAQRRTSGGYGLLRPGYPNYSGGFGGYQGGYNTGYNNGGYGGSYNPGYGGSGVGYPNQGSYPGGYQGGYGGYPDYVGGAYGGNRPNYRPGYDGRPGFDGRPGYNYQSTGYQGYRPGYNQYRPGFDRPYQGYNGYFGGYRDSYNENLGLLGRKVSEIKKDDTEA